MTEKPKVVSEKAKEMQERTRERNLIIGEMKNRGSLTIDELAKATGMEKSKLLKHLIAMIQFGKVQIVGERDNQFTYGFQKENKS